MGTKRMVIRDIESLHIFDWKKGVCCILCNRFDFKIHRYVLTPRLIGTHVVLVRHSADHYVVLLSESSTMSCLD